MCVHAKKKGNRVTRAASSSCCSLSLSLLKALNHDNSPPPSWWLVVRADWEGEGWNASISALPPSSFVPPPFFAIAKPPGVCAHFPDQTKMQNRPIMMFAINFNIVFFYLHALILRAKLCHDAENSIMNLVLCWMSKRRQKKLADWSGSLWACKNPPSHSLLHPPRVRR